MAEDPTAHLIQALVRAAADSRDVTSPTFCRALCDGLASVVPLDWAGLLWRRAPREFSAFVCAHMAEHGSGLGWGQGIHLEEETLSALSVSGPMRLQESAFSQAGLAWEVLAPVRWMGREMGFLLVAGEQALAPDVDVQVMAQVADVISGLCELSGSGRADPSACELSREDTDRIRSLCDFASLGRIVGGLIHEVNNPVTLIALAAGQIEKQCRRMSEPEIYEPVVSLSRAIGESVDQLRQAVSDFHQLCRVVRGSLSGSIDLTQLIRTAAQFSAVAYRTQGKIEVEVRDLPACPVAYGVLAPTLIGLISQIIEARPASATASRTILVHANATAQRLLLTVVAPSHEDVLDSGLGVSCAQEAIRLLGGELRLTTSAEGVRAEIGVPLP